MTPFEELLKELGNYLSVTLQPDANQSCRLAFFDATLFIQIDLAPEADQILVGSELGEVLPGPYREKILTQALRYNGTSETLPGILAFSSKKSALILFQFLSLVELSGEKLYHFLQLFAENARLWTEAIKIGEIPVVEEAIASQLEAPFGMQR